MHCEKCVIPLKMLVKLNKHMQTDLANTSPLMWALRMTGVAAFSPFAFRPGMTGSGRKCEYRVVGVNVAFCVNRACSCRQAHDG